MLVIITTTLANRTTNGREDFCNCILIAFILFGVPFVLVRMCRFYVRQFE
jgi:MFS superfamily sulfate permease-like transporter